MSSISRPQRTYVVLLAPSAWSDLAPLGTVVSTSRRAARQLALGRWPGLPSAILSVATASCAPVDVLGRALALDYARQREAEQR